MANKKKESGIHAYLEIFYAIKIRKKEREEGKKIGSKRFRYENDLNA